MISNIFLIFKSLLFWINLVISVLLFGPIAFLSGLLSYRVCPYLSKCWCKYNLFFLKYLCLLSSEFDVSKLNTHKILISRHQSAWETLFFAAHVEEPIFILKKELLMIPLFGWCLYLLKNISIDRSDGVTSLKKIIKSCNKHIKKGKTVIIFPEGTRTSYNKTTKIKKGILKLLDSVQNTSLVINHDAGKYWNKNSYIIKPGNIKISTLSLKYNANTSKLKETIELHFNS